MTVPDDVAETLSDIVELGFIRVRDGVVTEAVKPIKNLLSSNWDRWTPTLRYIADYARHHADDFAGEFFVCLYDGWREYAEPVAPADRQTVQWLDLPAADRRRWFIGTGNAGEPRFRPDVASASAPPPAGLYPVLCRPVLAFNRHVDDTSALLMPDSEFLETGFASFRDQVRAADRPFAEKIGKIYWRGSPNVTPGYAYCTPSAALGVPRAHQRNVAVALSSLPTMSSYLDAAYLHAPIAEMLRYKYLLNLDGMVSAWSATDWKLLSNSVVINAPSHWDFWYRRNLVPGRDLVQMTTMEPAEFAATFHWCESHPAECSAIAAAGKAVVQKLDYAYAVSEYTIH